MELSKAGQTVEFKWGDVTFFVKKEANEDDHMQAVFAGRTKGEHWGAEEKAHFCRLVCRLMVTGWKGVTHNGKDVDFDFELLKDIPKLPGRSLFLELGMFIIKNTDIQTGAGEAVKNA
jgi:hypothetical protein